MSSHYVSKPHYKRPVPAALLARQVRFTPGHPGRAKCTSVKRDGRPCGHLAAHGMNTCAIHHRGARTKLLTLARPRCEAWTVRRPAHQCERPAACGGLCVEHAARQRAGHDVALAPTGQRVRHVGKRVTPAAPRAPKRASPIRAYAAPRALQAQPVWRMARDQRERAALVDAWEQRDTHPEAWRKAVRDAHDRANGGDT